LRASDFGLPHLRRRLFAGNYSRPQKKPWTGEIVGTPVAQVRGYGNGKEHRAKIKAFYRDVLGGKGITFCDVVSPALYARVMGFPASYKFAGSKKEQYVQIGNAVCPPVAAGIARSIKHDGV